MDQVVLYNLFLYLFMTCAQFATFTFAVDIVQLQDSYCLMENVTIGSTFNSSGQCKFMTMVSSNIPEPSKELFASIADGLETLDMCQCTVEFVYLSKNLKEFRYLALPGSSTQIIVDKNDTYELKNITWQNLPQLPTNINQLRSLKNFECFIVYRETFDLAVLNNMMQLETINFANFVGVSISDSLELPSLQTLSIWDSPVEFVNNASWKFPQLVQLVLSNNGLQDIPEQFSSLTNLSDFQFSGNKVQSLKFDLLANMKELDLLVLSENKISTITTERRVELPLLRAIYLSGNRLTELNVTLWVMPDLQHLTLDNNQLKQVPGLLTLVTGNIITLDLFENPWQCTWIREVAQKIPAIKPIVAERCILARLG